MPRKVQCIRVLLEPAEHTTDAALTTVGAIEAVLDRTPVLLPRLLHGFEATAWPVFDAVVRGGYEMRVGLKDMLCLPNGEQTLNNAALVRLASVHRSISRTIR